MKKEQLFTTILISIILAGCSTTVKNNKDGFNPKAITKSYLTTIQKADGINKEEALLLAQNELIFRGYDRSFAVNKPEIFFDDSQVWGIRFFSSNKTMADMLSGRVVDVFIRKDDGRLNVRTNF